MMTSRRRLRSSASHRLEVLPPVPLSTYVTLLTLTHSRNDLKLFCLIVRTDLLLLLYGAPRRFVERRLTNLSLYCIVLYCIVLYCIVLYCIVQSASRLSNCCRHQHVKRRSSVPHHICTVTRGLQTVSQDFSLLSFLVLTRTS